MVQQRSQTVLKPNLEYPESDGKPLADNTIQFGLMMKIQGGIDALFANQAVFVAGDLFWYPVEGSLARQAPDVLVAFGRPKGDRGSYKQWQEDNIPPQVVFEILSPSNTRKEMAEKLKFYEKYGVEEYYLYDPSKNILKGWIQTGNILSEILQTEGWISPRLGIRFETQMGALEIYKPNGDRFESFVELTQRAEQEAQRAKQEAQRAQQEAQRAERADQRAERADQRAEQADQRAEQADQRVEQADQRAEQADQRAEQADQRAEQADQRAQQADQRAQQEAQARNTAIARLLALGLDVEQVAEVLGFSVEEVREKSLGLTRDMDESEL